MRSETQVRASTGAQGHTAPRISGVIRWPSADGQAVPGRRRYRILRLSARRRHDFQASRACHPERSPSVPPSIGLEQGPERATGHHSGGNSVHHTDESAPVRSRPKGSPTSSVATPTGYDGRDSPRKTQTRPAVRSSHWQAVDRRRSPFARNSRAVARRRMRTCPSGFGSKMTGKEPLLVSNDLKYGCRHFCASSF